MSLNQVTPQSAGILASLVQPHVLAEPVFAPSPAPWRVHAPFVFWLMGVLRPQVIVDLAPASAPVLAAFAQAAATLDLPVRMIGVDIAEAAGQTPPAAVAGVERLTVTRAQLPALFADASIDLLHLHAQDAASGTQSLIQALLPRLSPHAVVLVSGMGAADGAASGYWARLRAQYPGFELSPGDGLGIVLPGAVPPPLQVLIPQAGDADAEALRRQVQAVFTRLGDRWRDGPPTPAPIAPPRPSEPTRAGRAEMTRADRRLTDALLDAEVERARRRALAMIQARRLVAARRGLRGVFAAFLRRFGPGEIAARCRLLTQSGLFDREFYRREYPEAGRRRVEPVVDYLVRGGFEGCRPNVLFDSSYYLQSNPDVSRLGENPLLHYVLFGEREGRAPSASFDPVAYLAAHPELDEGVSPLAHYLATLAPEGSRPPMAPWRRLVHSLLGTGPVGDSRRAGRAVSAFLAKGEKARKGAGFIAFEPAPELRTSAVPAARMGAYRLQSEPGGYCYIPPRRPADLEERLAGLSVAPLFSIVVPLYNTPPDLLAQVVASVSAQWYANWELILVDDCSPRDEVRARVAALSDPRIVAVFLEENQGIAGATNAAIARARGDYVVFLDHDDELTEDCLYELALCIDREGADFIYSDEDKLTMDGRFVDPFFKPDWSPDALMSLMYTCHVGCVRRSLLEAAGPLRPEYDGSQDWDLILRVTEKAGRIAHIPKVLYHWRIIPGSAAAEFDAKPAALTAARRLREDALARRGIAGEIEPVDGLPAYSRVKYLVTGTPLISIIIPSKDNGAVLRQCLDSIRAHTDYPNYELVLVDNGSTKAETVAYLAQVAGDAGVTVVPHPAPFNFSEVCNIGARTARGEILLFLNDDTEVVSPDWLDRMAGYAQRAHVGAVGAKLLYPGSQRIQHAGVVTLADGPSHAFLGVNAREPGYFARNMLEYNWLAVTGACLMVERAKFLAVGGFDEAFPVAYNDVDLCYRLVEAGYFNVVCPSVELVHHESLSRGSDHVTVEKAARLRADKQRLDVTHPRFFQHDPFFNPNLHPNDVNFSV